MRACAPTGVAPAALSYYGVSQKGLNSMTDMVYLVRCSVVELSETSDKYSLLHADSGKSLTQREFFTGLQQSSALRTVLTAVLCKSRFESYFFESPSFSQSSLDTAFEFVCVDAPTHVGMAVDATDFSEYLGKTGTGVTSFDNIGGDARLIVPLPMDRDALRTQWYAQISTFLRNASDSQTNSLWEEVGRTALRLVSGSVSTPRWLSTAGSSVPWLHVRFDSVPKYFRYAPYRMRTA
jgi:hypothetical protein